MAVVEVDGARAAGQRRHDFTACWKIVVQLVVRVVDPVRRAEAVFPQWPLHTFAMLRPGFGMRVLDGLAVLRRVPTSRPMRIVVLRGVTPPRRAWIRRARGRLLRVHAWLLAGSDISLWLR